MNIITSWTWPVNASIYWTWLPMYRCRGGCGRWAKLGPRPNATCMTIVGWTCRYCNERRERKEAIGGQMPTRHPA